MPEYFIWGPVIGQNTVTGHGVLPLTPLKKLLGHTFLNRFSYTKNFFTHIYWSLRAVLARGIYLKFSVRQQQTAPEGCRSVI